MNNPRMLYRWRYLNQIVKDWDALQFDQVSVDSISYTTSNLVTTAEIPLSDGVGDVEYFFTAEIDAPYYSDRDYAFDNNSKVGYGLGWTEQIKAVTNRVVYNTAERTVPSMGTDYFTRIREGESNMEWVKLNGLLVYTTNRADRTVAVVTNKVEERMTLMGDHSWRYHYEIPTNAIGGRLSFKIVAKEHYTNETDATTWLIRTNELLTVEETVTTLPYTATLDPGNPNEIAVILDDSSTHLKIEYNDEQRAFSLARASYQAFNLWTDARVGFRGNSIETNGEAVVSNSGVSGDKRRYDAPFDSGWQLCPEDKDDYWTEKFLWDDPSDIGRQFATKKINGWEAANATLVRGTREYVYSTINLDLALALEGDGEGSMGMDFTGLKLPLGVDTVSFTARIAQPIKYEDFAWYMDGLSCKDYAISAMVTMSRMKETETVKPSDMSPVNPSVSLVGYRRARRAGCYEFRMTRTTDSALTLELYKWKNSKPTLLTSRVYESNLLVPGSDEDVRYIRRTAAYFLLYSLDGNKVKLEGHLSSERTPLVNGAESQQGLSASAIAFVDENPGELALGGSYGVGSTDCRAGFGRIKTHSIIDPPTADVTTAGDARIDTTGAAVGRDSLLTEWEFDDTRWEVDSAVDDINGGLSALIPSNQVIQVWLQDGENDKADWFWSGYEKVVDSFTTNKFEISPRMPGLWKVKLQTGAEDPSGVVIDDIEVTPWEGVETWLGNGSGRDAYDLGNKKSDSTFEWVYTKGWITDAAEITRNGQAYELPARNIISVETMDSDGYAYVFDKPGTYTIKPRSDMEIERLLLVGGGGAGGAAMGGGGGGGGVLEYNWVNAPAVVEGGKSITITVGAGGTAPVPSGKGSTATSQPAGNNGGDSSVSGITGKSVTTAKGGGGGGGWGQDGGTGRSRGTGGGGSHSKNGGTGTSGQGFGGGKSGDGTGGGGGGAGEVGTDATSAPNTTGNTGRGGAGGAGKASDITGKTVYYGGGGGGGAGWQPTQTPGGGGSGGGGDGARYRVAYGAGPGVDGLGGGGGGGTYMGDNNNETGNKQGQGARGGCGTVILRVRTKSRICTLQPARNSDYSKPMGLRSPYIDQGMSLFSYSYQNVDSNCVMLVQIATNMAPGDVGNVLTLTESTETSGNDQVWTTIARHTFTNQNELASGTRTAFISLRQHWIYDNNVRKDVYTNVCGVVRVIVDPNVVKKLVDTIEKTPSSRYDPMVSDTKARDDLLNYGKITITKAYCYNEPILNLKSWFGFNVHTEGWDDNVAGRFAYLTDWPAGLSIALNFSALPEENKVTNDDTLGIGLAESAESEVQKYTQQNPFIQCAAITNGIGTVSFRARLFDTRKTSAVVTLYGSDDPSADQTTTGSNIWEPITNFVVNTPTYQAFEWKYEGSESKYKAVRLEAAGARHGRNPSYAEPWEWGNLLDGYGPPVTKPINRVFIDEMSVSELVVPRLKFLDVRPFREHLGSEEIRAISDIMTEKQQPLINESWGIQCRVEPQQMADQLDRDSIRVWMEVYRGEYPWGYEQWKDIPVDSVKRFSSELVCVSRSSLVFRSYFTIPESIMAPEDTPNMVYQYIVRATYKDKSGSKTEFPAKLIPADWERPKWYRGSRVGAGNDSGDPDQFSAYTILDSISPYRAWINELNLCDAMDGKGLGQFIELAVPQGANLKDWHIDFTDYNKHTATLVTFGVDAGVRNITSKTGDSYGVDNTNFYTFVSVCSPTAAGDVKSKSDGYWKGGDAMTINTLVKGVFGYEYPYGIQLKRPSGIIEHEIVMQGTNMFAGVWGQDFVGTNLLAKLTADVDDPGTWFYAGEDLADANTSLGVWRSHGEAADPSNWTNYMWCTPGEINKLKDNTLQEIPPGYYLEPYGGNVWIYSNLLKPQYMKQFLGSRELKPSDVIVVPVGTTTNITLLVTNWYQIAWCETNHVRVLDAQGKVGSYTLNLDSVSNRIDVVIDAVPQTALAETWGLTPENRYTPAVLDWLLKNYSNGDYGPDDLSSAELRTLSCKSTVPPTWLSLTEMYWLDIPPVQKAPVNGGSNIWFVASMGAPESAHLPIVESHVMTLSNGSIQSNVYVSVTMMITNTVTGEAYPPDRINGLNGEDSRNYDGKQAWTSVVFSVTGALQDQDRPDVARTYWPLQQYVFTTNSFGDPSMPNRRFQTRIEVVDPYTPTTMGWHYGWGDYSGMRSSYPIWYRWAIEDNADGRRSVTPLVPDWSTSSGTP